MSELTKRLIVAAIGIPIAVFLIYSGGYLFAITVVIVSCFALFEYYKLTEKKGARPHKFTGIIASVFFQAAFFFVCIDDSLPGLSFAMIIAFLLFSVFIFSSELWYNKRNSIINTSVTITGIIYISLPLSALIGIRNIHDFNWKILAGVLSDNAINIKSFQIFGNFDDIWGAGLILSLFATAWISDSAAYFVGKKYGKHKLFPRVSPKKSWEGAFAAFFAGIITFFAFTKLLAPGLALHHTIIIGIIISSIGQIGDLAESQIKRDAGSKDSSSILPGHGGFLDRFDSIIFIAPIVFIYIIAIVAL